jgi:hypothetical protein
MKVKFLSSDENPLPKKDGKFTIEEHSAIQKEFAKFKGGKGAANPMGKQPCHIIACWVGKDGLTCHYHCVDKEGNPKGKGKPTKRPKKRPKVKRHSVKKRSTKS